LETKERRPKKTTRTQVKISSAAVEAAKKAVASSDKSRRELLLPKSNQKIYCDLITIDPRDVLVPDYNMRDQALLNLDSPSVKSLYDSLLNGQIDPVLIREVNGVKELVYGSRRRFCIEKIRELQDPNRMLLAWVSSQITNEDAKYLCQTENEKRSGISAWEKGKYIHQLMANNPQLTQVDIARDMEINQAMVSRYLSIYSVPEAVVHRLPSPDLLTIRGLKSYRQMTTGVLKPQLTDAFSNLEKQYESFDELLLGLKKRLSKKAPKKSVKASAKQSQSLQFPGTDGQVKVKIVQDTAARTLSASFKNISMEQAKKLIETIQMELNPVE